VGVTTFLSKTFLGEYGRFFSLLVLLVLFVLSDQYNSLRLLALFLLGGYVIFNSAKGNFLALLFLMPTQRFIVFSSGGFTVLNFVLIYVFLQLVSEKKFKVKHLDFIVSIAVLSLVSIFAIYKQDVYSVLVFLKLFLTVLVLSKLIEIFDFNERLKAVFFYIFGVLAFLVFPVVLLPVGETARDLWGSVNNPNYVGILCAFTLSLVVVMQQKLLVTGRQFIILLIVLGVFGLMTMSRTFVVASMIPLFYLILVNFVKFRLKFFLAFIVVLVLLSIFVLVDQRLASVFNSVVDRFVDPRGGDVSGGRLDVWREYLIYFDENPSGLLFGTGSDVIAGGMSAHNAYIGDLSNFGLISLPFVYLSVFCFLFLKYLHSVAFSALLVSVAVVLFSRIFSHSFLGLEGLVQLVISVCLATVAYERYRICEPMNCRA
jgi:hypothetical protein